MKYWICRHMNCKMKSNWIERLAEERERKKVERKREIEREKKCLYEHLVKEYTKMCFLFSLATPYIEWLSFHQNHSISTESNAVSIKYFLHIKFHCSFLQTDMSQRAHLEITDIITIVIHGFYFTKLCFSMDKTRRSSSNWMMEIWRRIKIVWKMYCSTGTLFLHSLPRYIFIHTYYSWNIAKMKQVTIIKYEFSQINQNWNW